MSRGLGERSEYIRYRVDRDGEATKETLTLGAAVHEDYHTARNALLAALEGAQEDNYDALPDTPPFIILGGSKSHDYPSGIVARIIDQALGSVGSRYGDWVERVEKAVSRLGEYEPHGETLQLMIYWACVKGTATLLRGRGWRHTGDWYAKALELAGGDVHFWKAWQDAWSLVAILVVEAPILAAAEEAGAVDAKTLAWAKERKLLDDV